MDGSLLLETNPMQTIYGIHINNVGQVSVDVYSDKHKGAVKWVCYFCVRPTTVARLRRIYALFPRRFIVTKQWSPRRWRAYKDWAVSQFELEYTAGLTASLDNLQTSEPR